MPKMNHLTVKMYSFDDTIKTINNPGVAYVPFNNLTHNKIDFSKFDSVAMRVVITAQGNAAGADKGISIYDVTGAAMLCEVEWTGAALQVALAGAWAAQNALIVDSQLRIDVKGSDATEDIVFYQVDLQIMYV